MSINDTPITMAPKVLKGENNLICDKSDILEFRNNYLLYVI